MNKGYRAFLEQKTVKVGILFMNVVPVTAFAISALLGVKIGNMEIIGAAIVIFALVLNNISNRSFVKS